MNARSVRGGRLHCTGARGSLPPARREGPGAEDGHKPQRPPVQPHCRDGREIHTWEPTPELCLENSSLAQWGSDVTHSERPTGTLQGGNFCALSVEHHKILWHTVTGRSFRKMLEPSFCLRSVRDQTGWEGPATHPQTGSPPSPFWCLEASKCYWLTVNKAKTKSKHKKPVLPFRVSSAPPAFHPSQKHSHWPSLLLHQRRESCLSSSECFLKFQSLFSLSVSKLFAGPLPQPCKTSLLSSSHATPPFPVLHHGCPSHLPKISISSFRPVTSLLRSSQWFLNASRLKVQSSHWLSWSQTAESYTY